MIDLLDSVLPITLSISIAALVVLPLFTRDEKAAGCFVLPVCLGVWGVIRFIYAQLGPEAKTLYVCALAAGQLFLIYGFIVVIDVIRNPHISGPSSSSMDDKGRVYDADGKLIAYFDKD